MELNTYQDNARVFRRSETFGDKKIIYPTLGLTGESGEVADKVKKMIRDNNGTLTDEQRKAIALELGDVMWYVAALADDLEFSLEEICQMNLDKLTSRLERNKIQGSGDYR